MHLPKKLWLIGALSVLVAGFFVYQYVLTSALSFHCIHSVLSETTSPDGRYIATVSQRGCGVTTHDYRVVSIRRRGSKFDGENQKSWVFWMENGPDISANWQGEHQLVVAYSAMMGKKVEVPLWKDVIITSREVIR